MALGYRDIPTLYGMQRVATRSRPKAPSVVDSSMGGPIQTTPSNPTASPGGDPATGSTIAIGGGEFGVPTPGPVIAPGTPIDPTTGLPVQGEEIDPITGQWGIHHVLTPEQVQGLIQTAASGDIATAAGNRADAIRKAIMLYGWDPNQDLSAYTGFGSDLTPADLAAAQANPYSMLAGFQNQRLRDAAGYSANVGARGGYGSGAWSGAQQKALNTYNAQLGGWGTSLANALGGAASEWKNEYATAIRNAGDLVNTSGQAQPWWEYWSGPTQA